jgi:cell division protease FtsH
VAEELTQDDITTGAGNDIERATALARRMACEWGMSELGPLSFGNGDEPVFLGRDFAQRASYSDETARRIDEEVRRLVQDGYESAREILRRHRPVLDRISAELLEKESLDGEEVYRLIEEMTGERVGPVHPAPPREPDAASPAPGASAPSADPASPPNVGADLAPRPTPA